MDFGAGLLLLLVLGINFCFWAMIGAARGVDEIARRIRTRDGEPRHAPQRCNATIEADDCAVLMAAHNEHAVIDATLNTLTATVAARNVFVVSDGSTDDTAELAAAHHVNVLETPSNIGKARALSYALAENRLYDRYSAVMVLDADTHLDPDYFHHALPMFDDPQVVAVAGCARTRWPVGVGLVGQVLVHHRDRIYLLTQLLLKYGQTWRGVSATHIVPGFASVYRTSALREIVIDEPGLIIEDFHMTFEVHSKRLGRIAFHPAARAFTQDPATLHDYIHQVRRWTLGLLQTVRRHRPRRPVFALTLGALLTELIVSSLVFTALPIVFAALLVTSVLPQLSLPVLDPTLLAITEHVGWTGLLLLVFVPDYLLTVLVAAVSRRPAYLLAGLFFVPLRVLDAAIALRTIPKAFRHQASGTWISPARRSDESSAMSVDLKEKCAHD